jgi:RNA polymerase sigma-70 factor (ECF subfamily)
MNATEIDDVVSRVLGGEIDAYEEIVRGYQQDVWRVVAAMLFNMHKTEDLVHQTFINAYQHLHHYERGRDIGAWLKEIARNQVRQEIRRSTREERRLEFYQHHLLQSYDEPSAHSRAELLEEVLARCTDKLPSAAAKLVELRYQAALGFGEIAASIGRTVEATRQQLARIRLTLRDCVEKHLA